MIDFLKFPHPDDRLEFKPRWSKIVPLCLDFVPNIESGGYIFIDKERGNIFYTIQKITSNGDAVETCYVQEKNVLSQVFDMIR